MTLREALTYNSQELDFGTSGLRGLVTDMTDLECYINTLGFLEYLKQDGQVAADDEIMVAGDLRESTPRIIGAVITAIKSADLSPHYCGLIPTPAIAYKGALENKACVMVTGSHIPADRNGIKFYKPDGEVLKDDEVAIKAAVAKVRAQVYQQAFAEAEFDEAGQLKDVVTLPAEDATVRAAYIERYVSVFNDKPLNGKSVVVYQHSAVGRDIIVEVLEVLGATVSPYGRSETFIPIDSENVTPDDKKLFRKIAAEHPDNFAIVSTDGDSDRPFVIDAEGTFYRGDILGCITADFLGVDYVAVPISSNDAVDSFCKQNNLQQVHTKIGSPYVIKAMRAATNAQLPSGWEVNGGFLLGADAQVGDKTLQALPTRDAVLPILTALLAASKQGRSIKELFAALPQRFTGGGLVDAVPVGKIKQFKANVESNAYSKEVIAKILNVAPNEIAKTDSTDGLRLYFTDGKVVHFRPSGNAPQMRVYTNCDTEAEADAIVTKAVKPGGYLEKLLSSSTT